MNLEHKPLGPAKEGTLLDAEGNVLHTGPSHQKNSHRPHRRFYTQAKVIELSSWKMFLLLCSVLLLIPLIIAFGAVFMAVVLGLSLIAGILHRLRR